MQKHKNLIAVALFLFCLANVVAHYLAGNSIQSLLFNSDALYLPILFSDLIERNGHINDWFLTPNPYFFPDYLIYLLAWLLGPDSYRQIIAFTLLQATLTLLVIWALARQMAVSNPFFTATTTTIFLLWLSLIPGEPFALMLSSAFHYGIFIITILFIATWLKYNDKKTIRDNTVFFASITLLSFISTLSDKLFLTQVAAPLFAANIFTSIVNRDTSLKKHLPLAIVAIGSILGLASYKFFVSNHTQPQIEIGPEKFYANLVDVWKILFSALKINPLLGIFILLYIGLSLYYFSSIFKNRGEYKKIAWVAIFSFFSICISIGVVALTTNIPTADRYIIPALFWPIIIVFMFLSNWLGRNYIKFATFGLLIILINLSWGSYKLIKSNGLTQEHYPKDISCIEDALETEGLTNGVAAYWDAKYIQAFAKNRLNIAQHLDNLEELHWITSKNFFRQSYDFAVINEAPGAFKNTSTEALVQINGSPKIIKHCGDKSIYVYGKNKLHVRKFDITGNAHTWKACELPTRIGKATPDCEMEKGDINSSGHITYGPYERLPTGQYTFEISYSSSAANADTVGDWDVVLALPKEAKVLKNGLISGTDGLTKKITGEFSIDSIHNMEKFEIRTLAQQNFDLKIIYIRLERRQ